MPSEVRKATSQIINTLYRDGNPDKAILASLRNAPTITSHRAEAVWPVIMAHLDESQLSHAKDGAPTAAETAVYTATRFYALHQQGNQDAFVYASAVGKDAVGETFFGVLGRLRGDEDLRVAMDRRVQPLLATTSVSGIINSLTHLVSILKAHQGAQQIDYALLAQDLDNLQGSYEQASRVRLRWGQQYYSVQAAKSKGENTND
ncbi:MAG: type I-E CRISPR-associated protein Cse2/CasB [Levilactobacillus sp.]|uniref:Type I-E CRISPR-associated protein Cse2/CasB n=2 Tax=Levilactobacillus TaxID=2767886 RepID=A0A4Z0J6P8_9LACO|nr:type I-E CRISPR-associated protein Cse2/CasB [Levilactobacillus suantsaiihabitans]MCI1598366.1 type I-E CRISPR-associated protein Cse2/CasB [Levilactobacillus sp.]MCI1605850.1 type I-E CRISPR-associated protein Cse2/CasB [Levilactobacillus sp.]TGD17584.1 type I-E CRISPR-associated protein Cse2/CasB [Levilactobacillus suantsaiihabitans]